MRRIITGVLTVFLLATLILPAYAEDTEGLQQDAPHEHSWTVTDTATCTAAGTKTSTCACGETMTEGSAAKGHSYGAATKVDDGNHKTVCTVCGNQVSSPHSWDAGTETTKATCQQTGVKTLTCTACGATKTETIDKKTTHDFGAWTTTATTHSRECKDCLVPENGSHTFTEKITKQPTCKEDGSKNKTCSVCGYSETIVLTKLTTHTYDSACDPQCNVCSREREIEHTFTKVWSKGYEGHWHECTKCGEKADFAKHIAGPAATEEYDQLCTVCNYVITAKKEHKHTFETEWTSDKAGHWHACTGKTCNVEDKYAAHDYSDACDPDCNTCGYEREECHSYDTDGWLTSEFEHWNICAVCGEESKHEKHVAGPEASEENAQVCTVCDYELAPRLDHTHDFGSIYIGNQDSHWQKCDCGELSVPEQHVWDAGSKADKKTVIFHCVLCGEEKTEAVSAGFPWLTILLVILALICIGGIAVLVFILKRGGFNEEEEEDEEQEESAEDSGDPFPEEEMDEEDQMIDDFFASLDENLFK